MNEDERMEGRMEGAKPPRDKVLPAGRRDARRSQLASLFKPGEEKNASADGAGEGDKSDASATPTPRPKVRKGQSSGAVRALGLSLDGMREGQAATEAERDRLAQEAEGLRAELAGAERIVELDPELIDPAPIADRLSPVGHDDRFEELVRSIEADGQQVPVLVRPATDGRYQAAYGHRRIEAARRLGRPVRAQVRDLDDASLLMAQGKENADRRDLSFIERAMFARAIVEKAATEGEGQGQGRALAQAALSVQKSEMTRLLQVAEGIPPRLARAIGPAPKIGRPRWLQLSRLVGAEMDEQVAQAIHDDAFRAADSDTRFRRVLAVLEEPRETRSETAKVAVRGGRVTVTLADPALSEALAQRLDALLPDLVNEIARDAGNTGEAGSSGATGSSGSKPTRRKGGTAAKR